MKTYVYVDGESHFIRADSLWKELHGKDASLSEAVTRENVVGSLEYPPSGRTRLLFDARMKFFWDSGYVRLAGYDGPLSTRSIDGAVYYTDVKRGDDDLHHLVCVKLRTLGFEPQVVQESAPLAKNRERRLETDGILEKPKKVDIGLTVRLLEDGYRGIYDLCYLFTSDIDFLPVIQAVQRLGRKVVVFGFLNGLGKRSQLEYVPDGFVDLTEHMRKYRREQGA